ncbi:S-adenosyl-L-methionine-dependent methyltransferase [Mycena rosella]|uniref:S-adenosyl-L-methionine-dependent methyltransferase n=1 Tax=Mycena rosella TaxID=1033263 RepID=A0AAD7GQC7_MYCRO|nr:S-adenosyl-L-methionine-dependent methyltransferase [Mycena rosella]KAJ7699673.1 S-adenosyl-L-methionine-dependent methyltransferase [Mycena rosella]
MSLVSPDASVIVNDTTYAISHSDNEWRRLDEQHRAYAEYMGDQLTFAPLGTPNRILELGAGSGAWAIQAALMYPDAEVIAVDRNELPLRTIRIPPNMHFQKLDLLNDFPWKVEEFDVIHLRFVLFHVPRPVQFIRRVFDLLAPGGWLLIEEPHSLEYPEGPGPSQKKRDTILETWMSQRGMELDIGVRIATVLKESTSFEVEAHHIAIPFLPVPDDPWMRAIRKTFIEMSTQGSVPGLVAAGLTPELQTSWEEEMGCIPMIFHVIFTWSRKH